MTDTNNATGIRVLLVDDHPLVRAGIRSCLEEHDGIEMAGEASNGREAVEMATDLRPDIILMDISMPEMNGLQATQEIRSILPDAKVIILTMHDNKDYVLSFIEHGARGYLLKDSQPDEIIRAVKTVHSDGTYFSQTHSQLVIEEFVRKASAPPPQPQPSLSEREKEILSFIAEGLSNKEIAAKAFISIRTVETHRENIMRKLDIHSVAGLTKYAIANGLTHVS
jgi:two-component system nitrate/nitrite response regulator NarL